MSLRNLSNAVNILIGMAAMYMVLNIEFEHKIWIVLTLFYFFVFSKLVLIVVATRFKYSNGRNSFETLLKENYTKLRIQDFLMTGLVTLVFYVMMRHLDLTTLELILTIIFFYCVYFSVDLFLVEVAKRDALSMTHSTGFLACLCGFLMLFVVIASNLGFHFEDYVPKEKLTLPLLLSQLPFFLFLFASKFRYDL